MDKLQSHLEAALNENSRLNEQIHKIGRLLSGAQEKIALQEIALDDLCNSLNERDQTTTDLRIEIMRLSGR